MKKTKNVGIAITLILIILGANLSYAISSFGSQSSNFFTVNKTQASKDDTLELSFDISKIDDEKFSIVLSANTNASTNESADANSEANESSNANLKTNSSTSSATNISSTEGSTDVLDTNKISASSKDVNIEKNSTGDIVIDIDKSKLNLSKITLYYVVPDDLEVEAEIEFIAKAVSNTNESLEKDTNNVTTKSDNSTNNSENTSSTENNQEDNSINNNQKDSSTESNQENNSLDNKILNNNENSNIIKEEKVTVKIVEKTTIGAGSETGATDKIGDNIQENNNSNNQQENGMNLQTNNGKVNYQQGNIQGDMNNASFSDQINGSNQSNSSGKSNGMGQNSDNKSNSQGNSQSSNSQFSNQNSQSGTSQETEETYSGSDNNFLSSLSIDGVNLNSEFNKEKLTYFASASNVSLLTVTATAEDENATVNITGNTDLSDGTNKILISVTAENGSVRYYRIFVNVSNS